MSVAIRVFFFRPLNIYAYMCIIILLAREEDIMVLQLQELEELSLNQWPALKIDYVDNWKLRFNNGYTKRANSISSIHGISKQINLNIATCEHKYSSIKQPTIFKITPFSEPQLDMTLEQLDYVISDPSTVMTLDLKQLTSKQPKLATLDLKQLEIQIIEHISIQWLESYCQLNNIDCKHLPTMVDMLASIKGKLQLVTCLVDDEIIAMLLTVSEQNYIGIYDVVTAKTYRNKGVASYVLWNVLQQAKSANQYSYLAVIQKNATAIQLYTKLGYIPAYNYWYRIKP